MSKRTRCFVLISCLFFLCSASSVLAQIQPEKIPNVLSLPDKYEDTWVFAHDVAFNNLIDGRIVLLDVGDTKAPFKGTFGAALAASFVVPKTKNELYVAETFYSRGTRGVRTDVITIYDRKNLLPIDEIILPPKRRTGFTETNAMHLLDNDRLALVYNFTPAQSVSVANLDKREFVEEVPIPGCSMIYPTQKRSFISLCSNGAMLITTLRKNGKLKSQERSEAFFNIDEDPLFERTADINGIRYFMTFKSKILPIDLTTNKPKVLEQWDLTSDEEDKAGWRPGGFQPAAGHKSGLLYLLMHPEGGPGSHKNPGIEVWVYDVNTKERVNRIKMNTVGLVISVTQSDDPLLLVINAEMAMEVYDGRSGELLRTVANIGQVISAIYPPHL